MTKQIQIEQKDCAYNAEQYQELIERKSQLLNSLRENLLETKIFFSEIPENSVSNKDVQISEAVHWHNTVEDFIKECTEMNVSRNDTNINNKDLDVAKDRLKTYFKSDCERACFNDLLISMDDLLDILEDEYYVDVDVDDIVCNGWQMDFMLPVNIEGSQYHIEGSGYYRRLTLRKI
nr:hypothetical protein A5881_003792 [Enterococcus termitis]